MAFGTRSGPIFLKNADDLIARLRGDASPIGAALMQEVESLRAAFAKWEHDRPADSSRLELITRLVDLNRRVMDHVTRL